jgi:hypothetical protein
MKRRSLLPDRRRGRPQKFGRPSELVALTLPNDVIRGLRRIDDDVAKAIVRLYELAPIWARESTADVELVSIADRLFLIVVNTSVIRRLPAVDIIPLEGNRAFLALAPGRGVSDLELAVIDRLGDASDVVSVRERQALEQLRRQLRAWHDDPSLQFHSRAIIVVEIAAAARTAHAARRVADGQPDAELVPFADRRSLIVVNSTVIRSLPGVDIISLGRARAFLALPPGRVVGDLELAVGDQLKKADPRERQALDDLRRQLKTWRRNTAMAFHARAIIVVESLAAARSRSSSTAARAAAGKRDGRTGARRAMRQGPASQPLPQAIADRQSARRSPPYVR